MDEPTLSDVHAAAAWLSDTFGLQVTGEHVASLSLLLARARDREREACAKECESIADDAPWLSDACVAHACAAGIRARNSAEEGAS